MQTLEYVLPVEPRAAARARRALARLDGELPSDQLDDLRLLVTELITNVLKHGAGDEQRRLSLRVQVQPSCVHVEVVQPGPPFTPPVTEERGEDARESGWGLLLLDMLADRWGVGAHPTTVWFEMARR